MPKINKEEYKLLKELDDKWKWIARDDNYGGFIFCFRKKPHKYIRNGGWDINTTQYKYLGKNDLLFQFIQWEDESPYNIAELIEEYEREETEYPKIIQEEEYEHINWLLKRVKKEIKRKDENLGLLDWNSRQEDILIGQIQALEHVEMLINEIGKPSYFRNKDRECELDGYEVEEDPKYIIDTDDIEISDGNHYLTNLTLTKDSVELPIVGDKSDAIQFDEINQAQAIASYVGGRVEELEE